jgi:hypothetical protein
MSDEPSSTEDLSTEHTCPLCQKTSILPEFMRGQRIVCPECGGMVATVLPERLHPLPKPEKKKRAVVASPPKPPPPRHEPPPPEAHRNEPSGEPGDGSGAVAGCVFILILAIVFSVVLGIYVKQGNEGVAIGMSGWPCVVVTGAIFALIGILIFQLGKSAR